MRRTVSLRPLLFATVTLVTLLVSLGGSTRPAQALDRDTRNKVLRAAVKLLTPYDANEDRASLCSGSMLDQEGYILTNFHCIGYVTDGTPIAALDQMGYEPGDLYNKNGLSVIAITEDPRQLPKPTYIAQVLAGNSTLDFAIMKIVSYTGSEQKLKTPLPVLTMELADSDQVETLDEIFVIGYPGIGGDTVTATEGKISGFIDEDEDGDFDWFKTDVLVNSGNSGGSALNGAGQLIGIPTQRRQDQSGNVIYLVRPSNFAVAYLDKAKKIAAGEGKIDPGNTSNPPNRPTSTRRGPSFGSIAFGTGFDDNAGRVTGESDVFEEGIGEIHAGLPYENLSKGTSWGYMWTYEGRDVTGDEDLGWEFQQNGTLDLYLTAKKGFTAGEYGLRVLLQDDTVQEAGFTVGAVAPDPPAPRAPAGASDDDVVLVMGSVINTATRRPIEGAIVAFLRPGETVADFDRDTSEGKENTLFAFGVTGADGAFMTIPPLPRGEVYGAIVGAKGYRRLAVDDALEITDDDPDVLELDPVELDRQ
jgi:serine protease Do